MLRSMLPHPPHTRCPRQAGFAAQSAPLYLSEMAPPPHRGKINMLFQLATTIGILAAQARGVGALGRLTAGPPRHAPGHPWHGRLRALLPPAPQLINYGIRDLSWGWRLSLGLAIVPALVLTLGAPGRMLPLQPLPQCSAQCLLCPAGCRAPSGMLLPAPATIRLPFYAAPLPVPVPGALWLPDSPNSLIERGRLQEGRAVLARIRGTPQVDAGAHEGLSLRALAAVPPALSTLLQQRFFVLDALHSRMM